MKSRARFIATASNARTNPTTNNIKNAMLRNCRSTRRMESRSSLARITRLVESKRA